MRWSAVVLAVVCVSAAWGASLLPVRPFLYQRSSHGTAGAEALHALDVNSDHSLVGGRDVVGLIRELDTRMRKTDAKGVVSWDVAGGIQQWAIDFNRPLRVTTGVSAAGQVKVQFPWSRVQQALDAGKPVICTLAVPTSGPNPSGTTAVAGGATVSVLAIGHMAGQNRMVVLIPWEMPQTDMDRLQFSGAFKLDPSDSHIGYLQFVPKVGSMTLTVVEFSK